MELKQIKELMAAMGRTGTKRLSLKKEDFELQLERGEHGIYRGGESLLELGEEGPLKNDMAQRASAAFSKGKELTTPVAPPPVDAAAAEKEENANAYVTSPMVGTFYAAPSPDDPPFIKVGDKIDKNTVMCIIEAMKVMNEVKAGVAGTVVEVLVESGHPVEFGTKLYKIA